MLDQLMIAKGHTMRFIKGKKGAVAFEYVLIIGGVSVLVIVLLAGGASVFMPTVIDAVCAAMDGLVGITIPAGSCTP